jgi:hypothetical protein
MTIKFAIADIVTAFDEQAIGSKVLEVGPFWVMMHEAVKNHDLSNDRVEGQHFVQLPEAANALVSCGVGRRTDDPEDYVIRVYREGPAMFLKRHCAVETESVAVVVYTREAYLADPDSTPEEVERIEASAPGYTHVIVAVLAGGGPAPVVGPYRFVHNLAGGNHEYDLAAIVDKYPGVPMNEMKNWDPPGELVGWREEWKKLVEKAKATKAYADEWCVVAD